VRETARGRRKHKGKENPCEIWRDKRRQREKEKASRQRGRRQRWRERVKIAQH
jgi:hypothetical protein